VLGHDIQVENHFCAAGHNIEAENHFAQLVE
jgi:hypothetical protein